MLWLMLYVLFTGETKEMQPEQPPDIFFTLVKPGLFICEDVHI